MKIRDFIGNSDYCSNEELIELWNNHCILAGYVDDMCHPMSQFDDLVDTDKPYKEVIKKLEKNFNHNHSVFWINGYGYICSGYTSDFIDAVVDIDLLADSIELNPSDFDTFNWDEVTDIQNS